VFDAAGQWRDPASKKTVRESSKIVLIVLPGNADDIPRLNEIAEPTSVASSNRRSA